MTGSGFGHVDDRRVVEHRTFSLGNGFETGHQGFDLFHVVGLDGVSHLSGPGNLAAMPDLVDAGLLSVFRQGGDVGAQVVDGVGNDVGQPRSQGSDDYVGECGLFLRQGGVCAAVCMD